jgi:hypothetical protein
MVATVVVRRRRSRSATEIVMAPPRAIDNAMYGWALPVDNTEDIE